MRAFVIIAILAPLLSAAPDRDDPKKKDVKPLNRQMQGEWNMVSAVMGGMPASPEKVAGTKLIIKDKVMSILEAGRDRSEDVTFVLDDTKKPVAIDLLVAKAKRSEKVLCIIKIEGDTLTLCFEKGGNIRPTEFTSPPKTNISLLKFKRADK